MAEKVKMGHTDHFADVMKVMTTRGLLLATWKEPGKANAMAIGWGMIGSIWSRPIWQVLVRPCRYTFQLLQQEQVFTVNVMPLALDAAVQLCGTVSGANRDKLAEAGLSVVPGTETPAPIIKESVIHYECHVVHSNDFLPEAMVPDIRTGCYPSGDYHHVYWGEIVDARVDTQALDKLFAE